MRIAIIGAGIIGVTTAYELAHDGHEVTVFERRGTVAAETSFANAGLIAPGYVTPWAAPGMPAKVLRHLFSAHAPVRLHPRLDTAMLRWLMRWWRACSASAYQLNRPRMQRLALYSRERLHHLAKELKIDFERTQGVLVLARSERDLRALKPGLAMLAELGVNHGVIGGDAARLIEPGLNPQMPLHAAVHLPDDEVGNCRLFAQVLKGEAQQLGADFRFDTEVLAVQAGTKPQLTFRELVNGDDVPPAQSASFDAVVVCAALGATALLQPLGIALPLAPVYGYSITAPLRSVEAHPEFGPRAALMDERYKVAISRLGQRVRVAGSAEIGGAPETMNERAIATLYKVLDDWFPGVVQPGHVQRWKGARPMLPDGPPVLGAAGAPGVWLSLGHGSSGWALACGSARVVADALSGRMPAIDTEGLGIERLR
ncbi:MAG: FAD-dependent oxidoreductase [Betaproteobacteria bacterium]|nr:MAG: FAD-dependent oxidoreductase [Betaproteobacteria bacterium]